MHITLNRLARDEFPEIHSGFSADHNFGTASFHRRGAALHQITDKETGKAMAVLDTTGKINSLDDTEAIILLTQNKIYFNDKNNPRQTRIQDLSQFKHFYVDRIIVSDWVAWGA